MPTIITDFSSAENFQTAWIYHSVESSTIDAASANSGVPADLSSIANNRDTFSLVINGNLTGQGLTTSLGTVPYPITSGGEYRLDDFIQEKIYYKENTVSTTTAVTTPGAIEPTASDGTLGHIIGQHGQESTAWVSYNDAPSAGAVNPYFNAGGSNDIASPATGKYGVVWNNVVVGYDQTSYGTDSLNRRTYTNQNDGSIYTRMQKKRVNSAGYDVYNVQRQLAPITENVTETTVTRTTTVYKFYGVQQVLPGELNSFTANAVIIIPSHILQRSFSKNGADFLPEGLDMGNSHIRIASNRARADVEIADLKTNHGIEAQAVPVILEIGTDQVKISLNQILDVSLGATSGDLAPGQVLQYDGDKWINAQTAVPSIGAEPNSPINGQLWFDDVTSGKLFMWNVNNWVQITA